MYIALHSINTHYDKSDLSKFKRKNVFKSFSSVLNIKSQRTSYLYSLLFTDLSLIRPFVFPDAELSGTYVPWPGLGPRLQHQPYHTQEMAGETWTQYHLHIQIESNQQSPCWTGLFSKYSTISHLLSVCLSLCSFVFMTTTRITPSTTSATVSVSPRWCTAWSASAAFR